MPFWLGYHGIAGSRGEGEGDFPTAEDGVASCRVSDAIQATGLGEGLLVAGGASILYGPTGTWTSCAPDVAIAAPTLVAVDLQWIVAWIVQWIVQWIAQGCIQDFF